MGEENKKGLFEKAKDKLAQLGETKDRMALLLKARNLMQNEDLTEAIADAVVKNRGELGYVLSVLKERPRTFNPYLLKGMTVYKEPKALSPKTAELVAVGAAAALHCEHCLEAHMARAVAEGATLDEIMDTLLVAGSIAESSLFSHAFRKYKQLEGKAKKGKGKEEPAGAE
jgi:AhpD family alkylhydroperoxidase